MAREASRKGRSVHPLLLRALVVVFGGLAIVHAGAAAAADIWRGNLQCGIVPGFTTRPLVGPFDITADGAKLTYVRPILDPNTPTASGSAEHGAGTLSGTSIQLSGAASGKGYSFRATYQGAFEGAFGSLTGEQLWKAAQFATPYHRACTITLTRRAPSTRQIGDMAIAYALAVTILVSD